MLLLNFFIELKGKLPQYLWRAEMGLADLVKVNEVKTKTLTFKNLFIYLFFCFVLNLSSFHPLKSENQVAAVVTALEVMPPLPHLCLPLESGNLHFHLYLTPNNPALTWDRGAPHLAWHWAGERTLTLTSNSIRQSGKGAKERHPTTWLPTPSSVRRPGPVLWPAVAVEPRVVGLWTSANPSISRRSLGIGSSKQVVRTFSYLLLSAVEGVSWMGR